jgi:hypothetical protein
MPHFLRREQQVGQKRWKNDAAKAQKQIKQDRIKGQEDRKVRKKITQIRT